MSVLDIFKLFKEWRDEKRTFDITLLSAYHQDFTDDDMIISTNPVRYLVQLEVSNGHVPHLGIKTATLVMGSETYAISPKAKPLQQGEVRKVQLAFPTPKGASSEGKFVLIIQDTRGRVQRLNGELRKNR